MSSGSLYWEDRGEEGRTRFEAVGQRGRLYVVEDGSDGQYVHSGCASGACNAHRGFAASV